VLVQGRGVVIGGGSGGEEAAEAANEHGHTPLMEAACGGHVECASLLLDAGAQVNAHSQEFKETAFFLHAISRHEVE